MSMLFTKKYEGTICDADHDDYDVTITVTNDRSDICDGEFVVVIYFSEQYGKTVEWTFDYEPTADEVAALVTAREGRTVIL